MRKLYLTLTEKWFDMILSGEKPEEYRELKEYWAKRLVDAPEPNIYDPKGQEVNFKQFDVVVFSNGYHKDRRQMTVDFKYTDIGPGQEKWGAEQGKSYFRLHLGKVLHTKENNPKFYA